MKYNDLFLQAGMSDPLAIVYRGTLCHHEWQFVRTLASIFWINCETFLLFSSPKYIVSQTIISYDEYERLIVSVTWSNNDYILIIHTTRFRFHNRQRTTQFFYTSKLGQLFVFMHITIGIPCNFVLPGLYLMRRVRVCGNMTPKIRLNLL